MIGILIYYNFNFLIFSVLYHHMYYHCLRINLAADYVVDTHGPMHRKMETVARKGRKVLKITPSTSYIHTSLNIPRSNSSYVSRTHTHTTYNIHNASPQSSARANGGRPGGGGLRLLLLTYVLGASTGT
jgi:hypothetical protein